MQGQLKYATSKEWYQKKKNQYLVKIWKIKKKKKTVMKTKQ